MQLHYQRENKKSSGWIKNYENLWGADTEIVFFHSIEADDLHCLTINR
jgi:hypothetical protein